MTIFRWYVETSRIEAALRLIEADEVTIRQVAGACGFRDADTIRRAFVRRIVSARHRRSTGADRLIGRGRWICAERTRDGLKSLLLP